jgi:hypothetical protein
MSSIRSTYKKAFKELLSQALVAIKVRLGASSNTKRIKRKKEMKKEMKLTRV